ncbi:Clp protease ClpE (plasmid) [Photobacterium damselae subsp. damselae]|nr:Clp protease ClpE [Photobacterium damselae subsp. damselae]QAY37607.1 Clp protease ClpE [Photobacterium damselae subsp. damselae]
MAAALVSLLSTHGAFAALALDATRYIYKGDKQTLSAVVENQTKSDFGAQVWLDNIVEKDTRPTFIATPSFFKVKGDGKQVFRIMKVSDHMPNDKESIYWLNLQEIPPKSKSSGLVMAIRTKVKMIYRPAAIVDGRQDAEQNLTISYLPGAQWLVNSTPYIFAIDSVTDEQDKKIKFTKEDGKKLAMFMPGDRVNVTGYTVKSVSAINDLGVIKTHILKQYSDKHKTKK